MSGASKCQANGLTEKINAFDQAQNLSRTNLVTILNELRTNPTPKLQSLPKRSQIMERSFIDKVRSRLQPDIHPSKFDLQKLNQILSYRIVQHPPPLRLSLNVSSAARVAASKTSSTPSPVRLEHSRYFLAPQFWAISDPSRGVVNFRLFLRISSIAIGSSLRSFFSPTRMIGISGHRSRASSIHLCRTFSRLSGLSTEKPIRITWDFE